MYSFITGTIEEKGENTLVLNNNGIGYEIYVSSFVLGQIGEIGDTAKIYTYLHIREDEMSLYGFANIKEKNIFLELINISGIGPKLSIGILSNISVDDLIKCVVMEDTKTLSSIKGLGKKTAERLVLELKSKFADMTIDASMPLLTNEVVNTNFDEAVMLLTNMGLTKYEAGILVKKVIEPNDSIEDIISKSLKNMGR